MSFQFNLLCQVPRLYHAWSMVKAKGSAGGIDGVSIIEFEKQKRKEIPKLADELKQRLWKPQPYVEISVSKSKDPNEIRKLGMTAVRDKIVQLAIKEIIEPRYERIFLNNSYAYRPGKGATKAIRRVLSECKKTQYQYVLNLDIDKFFDEIDHNILQKRLAATGIDAEIIRLIMLCVKMGKVKQGSREWIEEESGTPQGAILSPILSNLYLHSFDQFAVSRNVPYVRYADDFLFLTETKEHAEEILAKTETYLKDKLNLSLNQPPSIIPLDESFNYLGLTFNRRNITITTQKREILFDRISSLDFGIDGLEPKSVKTWDGISNYYGKLLPQSELELLDAELIRRLYIVLREGSTVFRNQSNLQYALGTISFLSQLYQQKKKQLCTDLLAEYAILKVKDKSEADEKVNKKIIQQRKKEYRKKESETSGLLVNKPGTFIGLSSRGITISQKGKVLAYYHPDNLSQVVITGKGVSLSSNIIDFCLTKKIPIDFFDSQGAHLGSIMTSKYLQATLWAKQAEADDVLKHTIAASIITGKIKNQFALLKYFNKYHKLHYPQLQPKMQAMEQAVENYFSWKKVAKLVSADFMQELIGHESQIAIKYWDYIRELFSDDLTTFERREHQGAKDLVNSMLNYGYAILYVRIWQALLAAKLNPYESLIHVPREGMPTLVYDVIELFRSQVVDRVVISLIQKGHSLQVHNGLLTDETRQLLVKAIMERLARYEKFLGQEMRLEQIILKQAKQLAKAFDGKEMFKPYVAKW